MPPLYGSVIFPQSTLSARNISSFSNLEPFFNFGINGVIPLYTFGKIESAVDAAEAGVRVGEWDMEKSRQQMRLDVRKAWYGLQLARDAQVPARRRPGAASTRASRGSRTRSPRATRV